MYVKKAMNVSIIVVNADVGRVTYIRPPTDTPFAIGNELLDIYKGSPHDDNSLAVTRVRCTTTWFASKLSKSDADPAFPAIPDYIGVVTPVYDDGKWHDGNTCQTSQDCYYPNICVESREPKSSGLYCRWPILSNSMTPRSIYPTTPSDWKKHMAPWNNWFHSKTYQPPDIDNDWVN